MGAFTPLPSSTVVEATGEIVVNIPLPQVYKKQFDKISSALLYIGEALPGALPSAASWRIKKLTPSGLVYAGTGEFDQVWDDRAALIYT